MTDINAYLTFDGNCLQAMKFYEKCLGGQLNIMPFAEAPMPDAQKHKDRVMHARLQKGNAVLMASDSMPGHPLHKGNTMSLSINCESMDEIKKLFTSLSEKGKVTMPLQDTFWGAHFGMLTDQFGVQWMFNFDKK